MSLVFFLYFSPLLWSVFSIMYLPITCGFMQRCTGLPNKSPYKKCDTESILLKYVTSYQVLPRVVVGEGVQVSLINCPTKNGTHKLYCSNTSLDTFCSLITPMLWSGFQTRRFTDSIIKTRPLCVSNIVNHVTYSFYFYACPHNNKTVQVRH